MLIPLQVALETRDPVLGMKLTDMLAEQQIETPGEVPDEQTPTHPIQQ